MIKEWSWKEKSIKKGQKNNQKNEDQIEKNNLQKIRIEWWN